MRKYITLVEALPPYLRTAAEKRIGCLIGSLKWRHLKMILYFCMVGVVWTTLYVYAGLLVSNHGLTVLTQVIVSVIAMAAIFNHVTEDTSFLFQKLYPVARDIMTVQNKLSIKFSPNMPQEPLVYGCERLLREAASNVEAVEKSSIPFYLRVQYAEQEKRKFKDLHDLFARLGIVNQPFGKYFTS